MISAQWDAPDLDRDQTSPDQSAPNLVSLHFIRSALLRRWLVCVLSAVLGLLAAAAFLVAFPALHEAQATLVLAHQPVDEPSRAMATDVSLLKTRTLAEKATANLGLTITPEDFLKTVRADPVSSDLMSITLTAPSDAEAVRRLGVLTSIYLDFRGQQLSMQSNVYVEGIQQRIAKLQREVGALSQKIEQLSGSGSDSASNLSDTIAQRAFIQGRIDTLQQEIEDVTLQTTSIVLSSRAIDPAATEAHTAKRRLVLVLASGLIGGAAIGCGMVLFFAITSDRLRRRSDVAAALEIQVPVSVGRIAPISKRWLWFPYLRTLDGRRSSERQRLAHAIEMELPFPRREGRIAVACIGNADEVSFAVAAAAAGLTEGGFSTTLIDLTEHGSLVGIAPSALGSHSAPPLLRPRGIPTLASGPADLRAVGQDEDENLHSLGLTDVALILADLDPSVGADHLTAWVERVIIVVTAGRSSTETVRTAADMVRTAGLELRFAALLHTERTDDSSGTAGFDRVVPIHLAEPLDDQVPEEQVAGDEQIGEQGWIAEELTVDEDEATVEQAVVLQKQVAEGPAPSEEQELIAQAHTAYEQELAALQEQLAENQPAEEEQIGERRPIADEEPIADEKQAAALPDQNAEEPAVSDDQFDEQELIAEHETVDEEHTAADEPTVAMAAVADLEHGAVAKQASADQEQVEAEDQTPGQEQHAEERTPDEEQPANEKQVPEEEQTAVLKEQLTEGELAADDEQAAADNEQAAALQEPTEEDLTAEEQTPAEEQALNQEQAPVLEEQPADEQQAVDEPTVEMAAVADLEHGAVAEEASADQEQVEAEEQEQPAEERTPDEEQPADEEQVPKQLNGEEQALGEPTVEMAAVADLEHGAVAEQASADQEQVGAEGQTPDHDQPTEERTPDEKRTPDAEQASDEVQPADEEQADNEDAAVLKEQLSEEQPADDERIPEDEQVHEDEPAADHEVVETELVAAPDLVATPPEQTKSGRARQVTFVENLPVQIEPSPGDDELDSSLGWLDDPYSKQESTAIGADDEVQLGAEPEPLAYPSREEIAGDGWTLYIDVYPHIDVYPPAYVASGPSFEDGKLDWDWDWNWSSDDSDSTEGSVLLGIDDKVAGPNDKHSVTASESGSENRQASEVRAEAETREATERPVDNGQVSTAQGRQRTKTRTRTRTRRKRSRLK